MATISRASKTSSGTTQYADATTIEAAELNSDLNTLYNEVNGQLDTDNILSVPWAKVTGTKNPEDIDDTSATQAEHDTTQDPGDPESPPTSTSARTLPTNVEDEIQQLRYAVNRLALGGGMVRRDTAGGTNESATWFEHPVKGRNHVLNGYFHIYSGDTASQDAPDHWTKTATPTTLETVATSTASGEEIECHIVSDAASEGITQTISGLKASTRYLLRVVGRTASGDTINITTTGATGAVYSNAALTLTSTTDQTVGTILLTDATPTDIVINILSSASLDVIYLRSVELLEMNEQPDPETYAGYTDQVILSTATNLNTVDYTDIAGLSISVICPGPGYEILARSSVQVNSASTNQTWSTAIAENTTIQVKGTTTSNDQSNRRGHMSLEYVNTSPTAGTTYTYTVQGYTNGGTVTASFDDLGKYGQQTSTLTVEVRRRM